MNQNLDPKDELQKITMEMLKEQPSADRNQNQNRNAAPAAEEKKQTVGETPAEGASAAAKTAKPEDLRPRPAAPARSTQTDDAAPAQQRNADAQPARQKPAADVIDRTGKPADAGKTEAKRHVNKRRTRKTRSGEDGAQQQKPRVRWGEELLSAAGIMGRILLRMLSWLLNIVITVGLVGMITGTIVCGVFALWIKNYVDPTIDVSGFTTDQDLTTRLYYMDYSANPAGEPVEIEDQRLYSSENRLWVPYSDMPKNLINAFLAIEDKRFWTHPGVDWIPTAQATFHYFVGGSTAGGSTITQQLIKNLTGDDDVTIQRKVQEIFRALNLEKQKSKEEILEMYLNIINLGQGCYGVQAAAQKYFNKDVSELNLTECASLAAIPKSPTKYNPFRQPENNAERRHAVLVEMHNQGKITKAEYDVADKRELVIDMQDDEVTAATTNSWYTDAVIEDVIADLQKTYGLTRPAASRMIYSEGLSIYTCMDPFVQNTLDSVFRDDTNFPKVPSAVKPECSMVVLNPTNGNVLGLVGGRGEKTTSRGFNIATMAKRSPGSSIKPLTVYSPALEAGLITYGSIVDDTPFLFNEKTDKQGKVTYKAYPANLPAVYKGLTTINSAVERSVNTVAMKVLDMLTPKRSYAFSQKIGMTDIVESYTRVDGAVMSDIDYAPLALGALTVGVTPMEMAQAYTFLANDGIYSEARTYTKVLDKNGKMLLDNTQASEIVVSEQTACIMTKMLQNVVKNGTAKAITLQKYVDVAGKTGTATDDYDRWFCGYTPYYLGACWFGYTEPKTIGNIATVSPATHIWDVVMTKLHQPLIEKSQKTKEPLKQFGLAAGVVTATYCMDSGKLICDACKADLRGSRVETGYFTQESAPTSACDVHVLVDYDKVTGAVAACDCPEENLTKVGLIRVENRDFPTQVTVTDAQYVYREWSEQTDGISTSNTDPFFQSLIEEERYVGTSGGTTRAVNSFCHEHYKEHTEEETEPVTEPVAPPETPPETQPVTPPAEDPAPDDGGSTGGAGEEDPQPETPPEPVLPPEEDPAPDAENGDDGQEQEENASADEAA